MKRTGILGGGIAGLSLAYFLGDDSEVLEKGSDCGGLCRSFESKGFWYDLGGHVMFSKDTEILEFERKLLEGQLNCLYRKASVWFKGRHVKYPFENGLSVLDKEDIFECLYNFIDNPQRPQNNFEDWIYNTFGKGLAENYLIPYNKKIWNTDPSLMDTRWVERIPAPPVADVVKSALGIETEGYTHQLNFYYPKTGGFQALPRAFETLVSDRIVRNFAIEKVERRDNYWLVSNGTEQRDYQRIVCTIPIFDFLKALVDVPEQVTTAVSKLQYNSLLVVLVGMDRERDAERVAVYFPQESVLFHRLVYFDYFGKNYVPPGCSSYVGEITAHEGDRVWSMSDSQIASAVVAGLEKEGFLRKAEVVHTEVARVKYAYPIYDLSRERNLQIIRDYCELSGIELCGRFAQFEYWNSDAVIRSAKTVAERMLAQA